MIGLIMDLLPGFPDVLLLGTVFLSRCCTGEPDVASSVDVVLGLGSVTGAPHA